MTPDELIARIKQHVGNRTSTTLDTDWYEDRLNDGYRRLCTYVERDNRGRIIRHLRFEELFDIVTASISASPASNFKANETGVHAVMAMYDLTNSRPIERKAARRLLEVDPTLTGTQIQMWAPFGDGGSAGYLFYPLPTVATSIQQYVYNLPETLSSGGSAPVIPTTFHRAIHFFGGAAAADLLGLDDLSMTLEARASKYIATQALPSELQGSGGPRHYFVGTNRPRAK